MVIYSKPTVLQTMKALAEEPIAHTILERDAFQVMPFIRAARFAYGQSKSSPYAGTVGLQYQNGVGLLGDKAAFDQAKAIDFAVNSLVNGTMKILLGDGIQLEKVAAKKCDEIIFAPKIEFGHKSMVHTDSTLTHVWVCTRAHAGL